MDFLEHNLRALRRTHPDLAQRVSNYLKQTPPVAWEMDSQGRENLKIKSPNGEGQWLYNENLDNETRSLQEKILEVYNPQIIFWSGLGLGHHLAAFLDKPHPLTRFLLIVEPCLDFFCRFLALRDVSHWLQKPEILWFIDLQAEELELALVKLLQFGDFLHNIPNRLTVEWGYRSQRLEEAKTIWQGIIDLDRCHGPPSTVDGVYGLMNLLDNIPILNFSPPLSAFKGCLDGIPGIAVSSGPSLQYSFPMIKKLQGSAAIFAVDSAYRLLLQSGIAPQLTGCLERVPYQATLYSGTSTEETFFFCSPLIASETFRNVSGPKVFVEQHAFFTSWLFPKKLNPGTPSTTSVSHIALYVLWYLGCRPIYLVGQDLAFDPKTNQSHAPGLVVDTSSQTMKSYGMDFVTVTGNNGSNIETTELWWLYARDLINMVNLLHIDVINVIPDDYGMKLGGIPRQDPQTVFTSAFPETFDVLDRLKRTYALWRSEQQKGHQLTLSNSVQHGKAWLEKIISDCTHLVSNVYDFYLQNRLENCLTPDQMSRYLVFFKDVEYRLQRIMDEDERFNTLMLPIVCGVLSNLTRFSNALMAEDESLPETWRGKLLIVFNWLSELIIQCQMVLKRLERIPD